MESEGDRGKKDVIIKDVNQESASEQAEEEDSNRVKARERSWEFVRKTCFNGYFLKQIFSAIATKKCLQTCLLNFLGMILFALAKFVFILTGS
jgi:hypothetical protein